MRLAPRTTVRCTVPYGRPFRGRTVRGEHPPGLVRVRLAADCSRGRKGKCVYVLAKHTAPCGRGRHASGVRVWGPAWLHPSWVRR
jgi:hypothetical protein